MALNRWQKKQKEMRRRLREDENFRMESAQLSINVLSVLPVYILREMNGWGRIRLGRFIVRYAELIDALRNGKVTTDALAEEIYMRTDIKYDDGTWIDMKQKKSVRG